MSESKDHPKYFRALFCKASSETWQLVVALRIWTFFVGVTIAALSIYLQRRFGSMSHDQVKEALTSLGFGLGAVLIAYCFVFLFHFLLRTPKYLYIEAHARAGELQAQLEQLNAGRPDFYYEGAGSTIGCRLRHSTPNRPVVEIKFLLRFQNKGDTAHNLSSRIYACWINDQPLNAELADSTEPVVGRTRHDECKSLGFTAQRYTRQGSSGLSPDDVLLIRVEIRFRTNSDPSSPICDNEPIWKTWDPRIPGRLCDASESDVQIAKEPIGRLKAKLSNAKQLS